MKKILFATAAGLLFVFLSCSEKPAEPPMSAQAQKNLEASRVVSKAFETGDVSNIDNAVASDFVDHTDRGDMNRDSLKTMITMMKKQFPDMKTETLKEWTDDNYVFTQMRFTGNSSGAMGMPPGPYDMHTIQVVKFKDGKAVEHWEYMEIRDMMKMMTPPAGPTKTN